MIAVKLPEGQSAGPTEDYEEVGLLDTGHANHPPLGVRVFEEGVANFDSGKEAPRNVARRTARSARRLHCRRSARKLRLRRALTNAGLLPGDSEGFDLLMQANPYALRARGLDLPLSGFELGRALMHLVQRRGFKSNRRHQKTTEDQGMLQEIASLGAEIQQSGSRTLGEHLFRLGYEGDGHYRLLRGELRLRKRHTHREMYRRELDLLLAAQRPHHDILSDSSLQAEIEHCILFQYDFEVTEERIERSRARGNKRQNFLRAPSLAPCPLVPSETRCPKALWLAQRFRLLKEVNNLELSASFGSFRPLSATERKLVLAWLEDRREASFDSLRKVLVPLHPEQTLRFNLEAGEKSKLKGNAVEASLIKIWGGTRLWAAVPTTQKDLIRSLLDTEEDPEELMRKAEIDLGLSRERAECLAEIGQEEGHLSFSELALRRLLPWLEMGEKEYSAIEREFPERAFAVEMSALPSLVDPACPQEFKAITNPVVRRAIVELRKVVNTLVRLHGKPVRMIIELAREMKEGKEGRSELSSRRSEREKIREQASQEIGAMMPGQVPSRSDIEKYLLWRRQGGVCPYTGQPIPQAALFGGEIDVDHILPRWRSLDDSQGNKVVCWRSANADKAQRTPSEWLGEGSEPFRQFLQRVTDMSLPRGTLERCRLNMADLEGFCERQLRDTQYISRVARQYLELLYSPADRGGNAGERAVGTTRGGLTAELRRHWELNNLLNDAANPSVKTRNDHRHHAVDALVVALSRRKAMKRYADYWKSGHSLDRTSAPSARKAFALPWATLRADADAAMKQVSVSHRAFRGVWGPLHAETFYGRRTTDDGQSIYSKRVDVNAIKTAAHLKAVLGERVRAALIQVATKAGWDGVGSLPKDCFKSGVWLPGRTENGKTRAIKKVTMDSGEKSLISVRSGFVATDSNHHLAVYSRTNSSGVIERKIDLVPMKDVAPIARRMRQSHQPLVPLQLEGDWKLQIVLHRKESVLARDLTSGQFVLCIVQMFGKPFDLYLRDARDARPASEGNKDPFKRVNSFKALDSISLRKVTVDAIGRVS